MIRLFGVFLFTLSWVRAETPDLLMAALETYAANVERWAYTQTLIEHEDGLERKGNVTRFDPSRHPGEQWTLLEKEGRPATEKEKRKYARERRERPPRRRAFGELIQVENAFIAEESVETTTYEVPMRKMDNTRFPPEKFRVTVRVNKERRALEKIEVTLREAFRMALVAKVKAGTIEVDFTLPDPLYSPVIRSVRGAGNGTLLFVKISRSFEQQRSDFKRVKPYDERFEVKMGDLKNLDF